MLLFAADPFEMPFRLPKLLKRGGRQETPSSNGKLLLSRLDYGKCYRCDRDFGSLLEQMRHEYGMHKFIDAGLIRRADGAALTCFPCEPLRLSFWFAAVRAGGPRVLSVATCPLCHIATCDHFLCFPHAISHVLMCPPRFCTIPLQAFFVGLKVGLSLQLWEITANTFGATSTPMKWTLTATGMRLRTVGPTIKPLLSRRCLSPLT